MKANEPITIHGLTIRNRLAVPPMVSYYFTDGSGLVTDRHLERYGSVADGGFGLVIIEATAITKRSRLHSTELGLWDDSQIEGFASLVDRIHQGGAKVFVQLVHAGVNGIDPEAETASDLPASPKGITGHEMSQPQIDRAISDFVRAALRAEKAGVDGIEIHGCHGYLLSQFMNSRQNFRQDIYGTDKTTLPRQVLQAVRQACRPETVVGIRLGAFEPDLADGLSHARALAPYADFLDVSYGGDCDPKKPDDFPCSAAVYGAFQVKELLPEMPVFSVDHINSPVDVENVLEVLDMADIGRASYADPAFAAHLLHCEPTGRCLYCQNGCKWRPHSPEELDRPCAGALMLKRG